ncbi:zinc-binding dehydrogenase [Corallococcus sp. AB011P]|uniref:zinc-binding dehydrogenase n=1 Tax=Corallococcus sp. AB011P TaxID=2316735 RepID=UPI001F3EF8BF|nr:zinc-binding dehydrogenase [Corallococcus sp. AB011P]
MDAKLRQDGSWAGLQLPAVIGYDASGVIEQAGRGVTGFKPGDEVFYTPEIFQNPHGTYSELALVGADIIARKPPSLENKQMRPLVERVLPLEQVAEAHRQLDSGHGRGKLVLSVSKK